MLDKTTLQKYLSYNPETGKLYWKARTPDMFSREPDCRTWNTRFAGKEAGTLYANGYLCISIFKKKQYCHRLAAVLGGLDLGSLQVDHINGIRTDNRLRNLRVVSNSENARNKRLLDRNTSGVVGVYREPRQNRKPWYVRFNNNGYGGSYNTFEEAVAARDRINKEHEYHELHGTKKGP